MKTVTVIPARFGSTRFPGKVLAMLDGKPMIQHVYEKAKTSTSDACLIATDSEQVLTAAKTFGAEAVMTRTDHQSGTDRIFEAVEKRGFDLIINVQGDEPLLPTQVINELIEVMKSHPDLEMATVAVPLSRKEADDPNKVKVVFGNDHMAHYFSRAAIPFVREGGVEAPCYLHWGIYAYRADVLKKFVSLPQSVHERCEKLEQLRALDNGIGIYVLLSNLESVGVDTPADLAEAKKKLQSMKAGK